MPNVKVAACAALLAATTPAGAAPIEDVSAWGKEFEQAALANNPDAMLDRVRDVAKPGFDIDTLRGIFQKIQAVIGTHPGDFSEQFDPSGVGSFYKRINIAVHYPTTYMFYTIIFNHSQQGWQMVQFNYNSDVNDALAVKWPG